MRSFIHVFDKTVDQHIAKWPRWLNLPMTVVSFLGQPIITIGIIVTIGMIGVTTQQYSIVIAALIAMATIIFNTALKITVGRNRPKTHYVANMWLDTFSFPSGHSCGAMVAFGLLAYFSLPHVSLLLTFIVVSFALLFPIAVGVSRVYLGVHYASDVVGGWLIGMLGIIMIFTVQFA